MERPSLTDPDLNPVPDPSDRMFLVRGMDPDPLVRGMDPDHSIIKQK